MKKSLPFIIAGLVVIIIIALLSFGPKTSQNKSNKLQVSASFYPLYFFASQVGGNKADVYNVTPAGAEPHDYDPTSGDIAKIEKGNMLILNGGVESWGNKIKDNLVGSKVKIVIAGQGLLSQKIVEDGQNQTDPHIWLNPYLAKKEAAAITAGYISVDPTNKDYYLQNEQLLDKKLDLLDQQFKSGLASCKEKNVITSHAAFGYMAPRYGLVQIPISGLSPDAEPSVKQLAQVADFAQKNNVKYIFFEALVSPKLSQTIASEVGAKTLVLDPIEGISDNDIEQGKNYFTVMNQNLKNLQIALSCQQQ